MSRRNFDTVSKGKYCAKILNDDNPINPRDWDNLGTMVCFHRRYSLGDYIHGRCLSESRVGKGENTFSATEPDDFLDWLKENRAEVAIILPIFMYEHSGITISTGREYPFNDRWDSGQVGFIFVTKEQVRAEYSCKRISKKTLETATKVLEGEVKEYDQYLTGDVYGYQLYKITEPDFDADSDDPEDFGEEVDSCWGYYGADCCKQEVTSLIDWHIKDDEKTAWESLPAREMAMAEA